jgi:tRNA (cmo5U34)-methyltransferase
MTDFNSTNWSKPEFSRQYRENADIYIVERRRMFDILKSFYRHFLKGKGKCNVLDLGCGDGILTHELLSIDGTISATLIDGSADMLEKAEERLAGFRTIRFVRSSFQDVLNDDVIREKFDLAVSSLAIHHLTLNEKRSLFGKIFSCLNDGGCFTNIDVILAPAPDLEQWYMKLWQEWMDEKKASLGIEKDMFGDIIKRYSELDENKPDTLDDQLNALKAAGFRYVDCFYKYGIFAVYGGRKQEHE